MAENLESGTSSDFDGFCDGVIEYIDHKHRNGRVRSTAQISGSLKVDIYSFQWRSKYDSSFSTIKNRQTIGLRFGSHINIPHSRLSAIRVTNNSSSNILPVIEPHDAEQKLSTKLTFREEQRKGRLTSGYKSVNTHKDKNVGIKRGRFNERSSFRTYHRSVTCVGPSLQILRVQPHEKRKYLHRTPRSTRRQDTYNIERHKETLSAEDVQGKAGTKRSSSSSDLPQAKRHTEEDVQGKARTKRSSRSDLPQAKRHKGPPDRFYEGVIDRIDHTHRFGLIRSYYHKPEYSEEDRYSFIWRPLFDSEFSTIKSQQRIHFKFYCDSNKLNSAVCAIRDAHSADSPIIPVLPSGDETQERDRRNRTRSSSSQRKHEEHTQEIVEHERKIRESLSTDRYDDKKKLGIEHSPSVSQSFLRYTGESSTVQVQWTRVKPLQYLGSVVEIRNTEGGVPSVGFIRPDIIIDSSMSSLAPRSVMFHAKNVKPNGIKLEKGDRVKFVLRKQINKKPYASRIYLHSISHKRSVESIEHLLQGLLSEITDNDKEDAKYYFISSLLKSNELWESIGNFQHINSVCIDKLMDLIIMLDSLCVGFFECLQCILQTLLDTRLFDSKHGKILCFVQEALASGVPGKMNKCKIFFQRIAVRVPKRCHLIIKLIKPLHLQRLEGMESFLWTLMTLSFKENETVESQEWYELPLVPSPTEILDGPLEGYNTRPIKLNGPYESSDRYIDINFRLFRADCFHALNTGVRALLNGTLDDRDMNAYHSVRLHGLKFENEVAPLIAVYIIPFTPVDNWNKSSRLMFGNLVCISITGTFKDPIWATVAGRALLKPHNIVVLQLCSDCNISKDADVIFQLERTGAQSFMVESPTYYRSYQPILKSIQSMDPKDLKFEQELVRISGTKEPGFIKADTTLKLEAISSELSNDMTLEEIDKLEQNEFVTTLDISQLEAIKQCLKNRVAIVQGPPGTGKTYLGVKLVQILDSISTKPDSPILVLTYKNHALDEFMKQLLEIFPHEVARIGGKSNDTLNSINLKTLKRSEFISLQLRDQLDELDIEISDCTSRINQLNSNLTKTLDLNFLTCVKYLTSEQIKKLLEGFYWKEHKLSSLLENDESYLEWRENIKIGKPNKYIDRFEIKFLLTKIGDIKTYIESIDIEIIPNMRRTILHMLTLSFQDWVAPCIRNLKRLHIEMNNEVPMFPDTNVQTISEVNPNNKAKEEEDEDVKAVERKRISDLNLSESSWKKEDFPSFKCAHIDVPNMHNLSVGLAYVMTKDIMKMTSKEQSMFVQHILQNERHKSAAAFKQEVEKFKTLHYCKAELRRLHDFRMLKSKKVVGLTITGVNIHATLISQLKPAIIIVEEAAEVAEPQILSVLGPWVEQLILIGDHKQLRPNVECFELKRKFHLDVSMMERLVMNGHPYSKLRLQNRMRPEFAEMLLDIYPELSTNVFIVLKNDAPKITSSMYFWTHSVSEISEKSKSGERSRSFTNPKEADRCVRLALFFVMFGKYKPCQITILAAYLGQKTLLRNKFYEAARKHNELFKLDNCGTKELRKEDMINIQTIDNYQGDENDIIIVSLVRSNDKGNIGFLNTLNRRCVAQSRAKCGMFFIGDDRSLNTSKYWQPLLRHMADKNCRSPKIPLNCPYHPDEKIHVTNAEDIPLHPFCDKFCTFSLPCKLHKCLEKCQPFHDHFKCKAKVNFSFSECDHFGTKMCFEDESTMRCMQEIQYELPCSHKVTQRCSQICKGEGVFILCRENVTYKFKHCEHTIDIECYENEYEWECKLEVPKELACGHKKNVVCSVSTDSVKCAEVVTVKLKCEHVAKRKCYERDTEYLCQTRINYKLPCGHRTQRKCHEPESHICSEKCSKILPKCGHRCTGLCGEPCTEEDKCTVCAEIAKRHIEQMDEMRLNEERDRILKELALLKEEESHTERLVTIDESDHEYHRISDIFHMYCHGDWNPIVTSIEKFHDQKVYMDFLNCKSDLHDPSIVIDLFTSNSNVNKWDELAANGLRLNSDPTTCISADTQEATIALCSVAIGKCLTIKEAEPWFTCEGLNTQGFDSIFVSPAKIREREFYLVYRANQLMPKYKISFKKQVVLLKPLTIKAANINLGHEMYKLLPKSKFDANDHLDMHFRLVESQFHRLHSKNPKFQKPKIAKIEYHVNYKLQKAFEAKENEMKERLNDPQKVLAFHGTQPESIDSIVKTGFDLTKIKRTAHGFGVYFSEFPDVSAGYGAGLLLCQVLTGRSYEENGQLMQNIPRGYDSISVKPNRNGHIEILVIDNPDQILPSYVVYLDEKKQQ